jgi:hypothetical protein
VLHPPKRQALAAELPENLVTHAAVTQSTGKLFEIQLLGEAQVDVAGVIQNLDLLGRKRQIEAGEIVLQLTEFAGAENRDKTRGRVRAISNRLYALSVLYSLSIVAIAISKEIGHDLYVRVTSVIQATQSESSLQ